MALTRAAASSIASGRPSRRSHSFSMVSSVASSGKKSGLRCRARSRNRRRASSARSGSSRHTVSPSTASGSRLVAEDADLRARVQQRRGQLCTFVDDVLAVVEDDQEVALGQVLTERVERFGSTAAPKPSTRAVSVATWGVSVPAAKSTSHTPPSRRRAAAELLRSPAASCRRRPVRSASPTCPGETPHRSRRGLGSGQ